MTPAKKAPPLKKSAAPKKAAKPVLKTAKKPTGTAPKESIAVLEKVEPIRRSGSTPPAAHAPAAKKPAEAKAVPSIRIRLSAFDHTVLDEAAAKIIDTALRSGAVVHGPIPLPTKIRKFTVNRATFKFKNARDQFEMRTHLRLIDLKETTFKTMESLQGLSLPSGVDIEIKMR